MAAVTQAQANQRRTELDFSRYAPLAKDGSVSQQEFDNAVQNNLANKARWSAIYLVQTGLTSLFWATSVWWNDGP